MTTAAPHPGAPSILRESCRELWVRNLVGETREDREGDARRFRIALSEDVRIIPRDDDPCFVEVGQTTKHRVA